MKNSVFHQAVPNWGEKVCIFILLIGQMLISGISASTIAPLTSFLGDERDSIRLIYYAGVIASMSIYPLIGRFLRYLRMRQILLWGISLELLLSLLSSLLQNYLALFLCNYLLASIKMLCLITVISLYMRKYNLSNSRGLFYGSYYAISFTISQIYAYLVTLVLQSYSWRYTFLISIPGLFVSLLIVVFFFHKNRMSRKYPLYQVDWIGYLLFVIPSLCLAFGCIYGERLNWLRSSLIQQVFLVAALAYALWIIRMLSIRRPYVNVRVFFKYAHISWGISLMVVMYFLYNTYSIPTEFMKVNLHYTDRYVAASNLFQIVAFVLAIPLTGIWLHRHHRVREPLVLGFSLFAFYYLYTARIFYAEENENFFLLPLLLRGAAYGMSLTSLSYYASVNVPATDNGHRAFFSIVSRYVIAAPVSEAFWQDQFNWLKARQYTILSAQYTADDYRVHELLGAAIRHQQQAGHGADLARSLAEQSIRAGIHRDALILSAQNMYYLLAAVSVLFVVLVASLRVLNIHYEVEKNKYPLTYIDVDM